MGKGPEVDMSQIPDRLRGLAPGDKVRTADGKELPFVRWQMHEGKTQALLQNPWSDRSFTLCAPEFMDRVQ